MRCPFCRQNAPLVNRGPLAYCAACKRLRSTFSPRAVNFTGRPSKLGGRVGMVLGWAVLICGAVVALAATVALELLIPGAYVGFAVGIPILLLTLLFGLPLLLGGRRLQRAGAEAERRGLNAALFALASHQGGTVTIEDAARCLEVDPAQAETWLTGLARARPDDVSLEVDDEGRLFYVFSSALTADPSRERYRVDAPTTARVDSTEEDVWADLEEGRLERERRS